MTGLCKNGLDRSPSPFLSSRKLAAYALRNMNFHAIAQMRFGQQRRRGLTVRVGDGQSP